eukprot:142904-Rhodomonas_salina.1
MSKFWTIMSSSDSSQRLRKAQECQGNNNVAECQNDAREKAPAWRQEILYPLACCSSIPREQMSLRSSGLSDNKLRRASRILPSLLLLALLFNNNASVKAKLLCSHACDNNAHHDWCNYGLKPIVDVTSPNTLNNVPGLTDG